MTPKGYLLIVADDLRSDGSGEVGGARPAGTVHWRWRHGRNRPEPRRSSSISRIRALESKRNTPGERGGLRELTQLLLGSQRNSGRVQRWRMAAGGSLHEFGSAVGSLERSREQEKGLGIFVTSIRSLASPWIRKRDSRGRISRRRLSLLLGGIRNCDNGRNPSSRASRVGKRGCGEVLELYRGGFHLHTPNPGRIGIQWPWRSSPAWLREGEEGKREVTLTRGPRTSSKGKKRGRVCHCSAGFGPRFGLLWASWAKLLLLR